MEIKILDLDESLSGVDGELPMHCRIVARLSEVPPPEWVSALTYRASIRRDERPWTALRVREGIDSVVLVLHGVVMNNLDSALLHAEELVRQANRDMAGLSERAEEERKRADASPHGEIFRAALRRVMR